MAFFVEALDPVFIAHVDIVVWSDGDEVADHWPGSELSLAGSNGARAAIVPRRRRAEVALCFARADFVAFRFVDPTAEHQQEFRVSSGAAVGVELLHPMAVPVGDVDIAVAVDGKSHPMIELPVSEPFKPFHAPRCRRAGLKFGSPGAHTPAPGLDERSPDRELVDPDIDPVGDEDIASRFVDPYAARRHALTGGGSSRTGFPQPGLLTGADGPCGPEQANQQ